MSIYASPNDWRLETANTAYVFGLNRAGLLVHRYWGPRLPHPEDYPAALDPEIWGAFNNPAQRTPEEYPSYADVKFVEPCIKVSFADGTRDLVLRFQHAEVQAHELRIHLHDPIYPLQVTLHYAVHAAYDLIERWVTLENLGEDPISIERLWSAQWHLPAHGHYRLSHLVGRHMDEAQLRRELLAEGVKVIESRRLSSSHHHNPWFAVDHVAHSPLGPSANEDSGAVWFGALAWSGNWKLAAEVTDFASTRLSIGLNDWDFAWRLQPGSRFRSPPCLAGYSGAGFGGASRCLHRYIRAHVLRDGSAPREVFYNSWEATFFAVDEPSQIALAEIAAEIGVELFVLDDGWFQGRNDDSAALGDWWPDPQKFPNGLHPLIERVNALGMKFGLWIEPEMVSPNSQLYRAHPDWVIHFPKRPRTETRNQLILNMGRPEVQHYLIEVLDRLLREHRIDFIKWDMNRNVSEPGWPDAPGDSRELWVRYIEGLYHVWGTLRARHPHIHWQNCSGGGGRVDLGLMGLADQLQMSDNIDPTLFLQMHEGFGQIFPANTRHAWIADVAGQHLGLAFRFHASMCGILGIGGHLSRWSAAERAEAKALIAQYKALRPIIQQGDEYRLRSAQDSPFSALQYVSTDRSEAVLFAFRTHMPPRVALPPLRLRGLDPQGRYQIEGIAEVRSGAAWMQLGVGLELGDFSSTLRQIRRVD